MLFAVRNLSTLHDARAGPVAQRLDAVHVSRNVTSCGMSETARGRRRGCSLAGVRSALLGSNPFRAQSEAIVTGYSWDLKSDITCRAVNHNVRRSRHREWHSCIDATIHPE